MKHFINSKTSVNKFSSLMFYSFIILLTLFATENKVVGQVIDNYSRTFCSGEVTTAIGLPATNSFLVYQSSHNSNCNRYINQNVTGLSWVCSDPTIGLVPPSGNSDIPSFTALNAGTNPVVADVNLNYCITIGTNSGVTFGCQFFAGETQAETDAANAALSDWQTQHQLFADGSVNCLPKNFTLTVLPASNSINSMQSVPNTIICSGNNTNAINFLSSKASNSYSWTNDNPSIGIESAGYGNIPSFMAVNTSGSHPDTATFVVKPRNSGYAYTVNTTSNSVSVIDRLTHKVKATIPVGLQPKGIAVNADGSQIYVANSAGGSITVINGFTNTVDTTIIGLSNPSSICLSPNGEKAYVLNPNFNTVSVVDLIGKRQIKIIHVGISPQCIAMSPDGQHVFVGNKIILPNIPSGTVSVIRTDLDIVQTTIPSIGINPMSIAFDLSGGGAYKAVVACQGNLGDSMSKKLIIINSSTMQKVDSIILGKRQDTRLNFSASPTGIAFSPNKEFSYVSNYYGNTVSMLFGKQVVSYTINNFPFPDIIISTTKYQIKDIHVGSGPEALSVSPDGAELYVLNSLSNSVTIINAATGDSLTTIPVQHTFSSMGNFVTGGFECSAIADTFKIIVKPSPVVSAQSNQMLCAGANTNIIHFTGNAGNSYSWSNTLTSIGLDANGTGDIASFAVQNNGSSAVTAKISAIPHNAVDFPGCPDGAPVTVLIKVFPMPAVDSLSNVVACANTTVPKINLTGKPGGNLYSWLNSNPSIGLLPSGVGNSIDGFVAQNSGTSPITSMITVVPLNSGYVYMANGDGYVYVINRATNNVDTTIRVGNYPSGLAVSPDGFRVYVTNSIDNSVSVIDTRTYLVQTINVGQFPYGIAISQDGNKVYVANQNSNNVSVINTQTNNVTTIPVGNGPNGIVVSPDGQKVYVANNYSRSVSVINTAVGLPDPIEATIDVEDNPVGIAISPDGRKVYVANSLSDSVSVISTAGNKVINTVHVGAFPFGVAISPDGSKVFVTNAGSDNVSVIRTTDDIVTNTIPVGGYPNGISFSPDGSKAFAVNNTGNTVSIIDATLETTTGTISHPDILAPVSLGNFVTGSGCTGPPASFTITVNPTTSRIDFVGDQTRCAGNSTAAINFTGSQSGATYHWTNNKTSIGLAATGSGIVDSSSVDIAPFVALNSGTSPDTATITVSTIKSGCASTQNRSFQIIVNPSPIVFPVASQILCAGNNTSVIHFSSTPAGNTYSWSHSNASIGLAASGTGDSIQSFVAVNNGLVPVIDTFSVVAFNAGLQCTGAPVKFTIKIYPLPVVSTASTSTTCNANDGIATALVSSGTPAYSYLWTPGNQTTATVTNLAPGPYSVRVTDSKGCKKIAAVTVSAGTSGPPAPAAIFGEPSGCRSTCSNIYSIAAVSGATSYVWTLPLHATGSSTGTSISVCFDALYTTGSICVQAVNSCGTSSPTCKSLPLSTVAPAIPGTITGPVALCSPNCTTYSIPAVPNATSYVWTTTGGLVINSGLGTTSISVCASPGFANGRVEVSAKNCFGISGIRGINVTGVTAIPAWTSVSNVRNISGGICGPGPGGISNNASTSGSWRYEVSPVIGASSLTWSAPPNFVITDGNGHSGNPLTVIGVNPLGSYGVFLFVPVGFVSGNVSVYATNGCGTSAIASLAITSAPATPGAISGPVSVCRRATKNYSINPITGASSYTWAVTGGAAIKSGQGTRAVSIKFDTSSSTTVLLSVVANDVCNSSAPASLSIAVNPACRSGEDETGVTDLATSYQLNSLIVFPNPATSKVNLEFFSDRKASYAMKIIDAVGRMLYNENMAVVEGVNSKEVNIENIAPGMYLISLQHEGDDVQNLRLIVE